jgi:cytosine/adenosine deaminase-related metal-dependent hydrolase
VRELIAAHAGDATVSVQPAPHSPHGASAAMIRAGAEVAAAADTKLHIHVAEGQYEGERTRAEHGATPLRYLDALGALGPRTIGVHCVWLDDGELALMAERGAGLAYCPSSNMILGDGITRIPRCSAGIPSGLAPTAAAPTTAERAQERLSAVAARHLDRRAGLEWDRRGPAARPARRRIAPACSPTSWPSTRAPVAEPAERPGLNVHVPPGRDRCVVHATCATSGS